MKLEDLPAAIIASSERHIAEAELRMSEDGLDFDAIAAAIALIQAANRPTAEQVRDALLGLRQALETNDPCDTAEYPR
jgi:hypothetical protein